MSTTARAGQLVKAPVDVYGIEGRYAHAIYSAATKNKKLDAVDKDMKKVEQLLEQDKKFAAFVLDPTLKKTQKKGKRGSSILVDFFCKNASIAIL